MSLSRTTKINPNRLKTGVGYFNAHVQIASTLNCDFGSTQQTAVAFHQTYPKVFKHLKKTLDKSAFFWLSYQDLIVTSVEFFFWGEKLR